ncbi:hypothetical protein ACH492_39950 [Streptomyces sp. NPDC019443]|uniref:hypothetical protein n=1 Tax=Streptomyces sp. NPDC019443 TaxID=3365061 RepID=UPI0037981474
MIRNVMRAAVVAALAALPLTVPTSAPAETRAAQAAIKCPGGYVCIYPEVNFGASPGCAARPTAA